jgi:hypothetical protein
MFFDIFLDFYFLPHWSLFDAEMRADLDFFDAEKPNPIHDAFIYMYSKSVISIFIICRKYQDICISPTSKN